MQDIDDTTSKWIITKVRELGFVSEILKVSVLVSIRPQFQFSMVLLMKIIPNTIKTKLS